MLKSSHQDGREEDERLAVRLGHEVGHDRELREIELEIPHDPLERRARRLDVGEVERDVGRPHFTLLQRPRDRIIAQQRAQPDRLRIAHVGVPFVDPHSRPANDSGGRSGGGVVKRRLVSALGFVLAVVTGQPAAQDAWPAKPVRLVVPSSPGGGTDLYARLLAQALGDALKQPFVVDNKPGASGNIGAEAVARAAPDGYTFLVSANPAITINPSLYPNLPYSAERDFVAVARGVLSPMVVCVHPSIPAKSLADLVALRKRDPGTVPFGSAGTDSTTYLGVRMLEKQTNARFLHVPYKGLGPAYKDLLDGQIKFMFADLASALPHLREGKAVALAVTDRTSALPGTPPLPEAGFAAVQVHSSSSVVAPTWTPPAVVQRISTEITKAMRAPQLAEKLEAQALIPIFDSPELAAASLQSERETWAAFIKRNGIAPNQ